MPPQEALFADDNPGHVERAASRGLAALRFVDEERFLPELWEALRRDGGRR
ncbi:MAG: hypothetical protein HZA60_08275 [Deltaproteobacteria bacterium]|nr:hypothetical protein [Deltaproteobacteria bacterium]